MNAPKLRTESREYFRSLGMHITELRKQRGMTQAELARALKVSQSTVFSYELGDRRVSVLMLIKLASIFDTSVQELANLIMPSQKKRRLSPAGVRHAERYLKLSKTQQWFVHRIIDVLLVQNAPQSSPEAN